MRHYGARQKFSNIFLQLHKRFLLCCTQTLRSFYPFSVPVAVYEIQSPGHQECQRFQSSLLNVSIKSHLCSFSEASLGFPCVYRERYFSCCRGERERKGENVSGHPPARRQCAARRSFPPTLAIRSSAQESAISRRGQLLPVTFR